MLIKTFLATFMAILAFVNFPAIAGETMTYKDGDTVLEGYLASPDMTKFEGNRPTILVIHQWKGLGDYEKKRADMLADLGYIAFAVDMYGQNIRPDTQEAAKIESDKYKSNPELGRQRINATLNFVQTLPNVDMTKMAAIGYCFGGTMALELARSGADINAIVSFHGGLATKQSADPDTVKASVQAHHGAIDPYVSDDEVNNFKDEMNNANVDWHFISYADAVHAFTEIEAGNDPSKGAAYNEKADKRSWAYTLDFLNMTFNQ